ncbi:MAG: hypothetical protein AB1461_11970 [Thermodesulfobacteriota bacterium]
MLAYSRYVGLHQRGKQEQDELPVQKNKRPRQIKKLKLFLFPGVLVNSITLKKCNRLTADCRKACAWRFLPGKLWNVKVLHAHKYYVTSFAFPKAPFVSSN